MPNTGLPAEQVIWAYRLLLEREPESQGVIDQYIQAQSTRDLVDNILGSPEFRSKHPLFSAPLVEKWALIECELGFKIWVNLRDAAISWAIINGEFESHEIEFVSRYVKPGSVAVDIGANIGFFSLYFAKLVGEKGKVVAFEPMPDLFLHAKKSIRANGYTNCEIHQVALADRRGSMQVVDNPHSVNRGGAYLATLPDIEADLRRTDVEVRLLSEFVDRADFIKIDIEGAEPLALKPYLDRLRETKPVIMSEIHPLQLAKVANMTSGDYVSMFLDIGYDCVDIVRNSKIGRSGVTELANAAFLPR